MQTRGKMVYFLGANTPLGFYSFYEQWIDERQAAAFYILKGGPGCGKSTLMKRVGEAIEAEGLAVEYILCSGDPDSLDGIYIPARGIGIVDGTAPHVIEPAYPGVTGHYVNLGAYYARAELAAHREALVALTQRYQRHYAAAYHCFRTAREVRRHEEAAFLTPSACAKAEKRAKGILSREAKRKKERRGRVTERFLSGLCAQGPLLLLETIYGQAKRVYELQESCGLAPEMLRVLEAGLLEAGYDIISAPAAEDPEQLAHILIPELSLAFVTSYPGRRLEQRPYRRIRMDSMAEKELLQARRGKLRLAGRIADRLLADGVEELKAAKALHDEMEALYRAHTDFRGIDRQTEALLAEIRGKDGEEKR